MNRLDYGIIRGINRREIRDYRRGRRWRGYAWLFVAIVTLSAIVWAVTK